MHGRIVINFFLFLFTIYSLLSCDGSNSTAALPQLPLIDPPKAITATPNDGIVNITWSTSGESVKGYQLYFREDVSGVPGEYKSLNLSGYTELTYDHTITNGNKYTYQVSAVNKEDVEGKKSIESNTASPLGAPVIPIFTSAIADSSSITLTWDSKPGLTYKLNYREAGGAINVLDTVTSPFIHTDTSATPLTNGLEYTYILIAINVLKIESSSLETKLTPLKLPLQATGLTATAGDYKVTLNWSRNPIQVNANNVYGIIKYKVYREERDANGVAINATLVTKQPIDLTTYTDNINLTAGTTYYYAITQVNQNGSEGIKSTFVSSIPTAKLIAASNLTLSVIPNLLKFSWTLVPGADEYELLENSGAGFVPLIPRIPSPTTSPSNGLVNINIDLSVYQHTFGTRYLVKACRKNICGPDSLNEVSTSTTDMLSSIGYFKAPKNDPTLRKDENFGNSVGISKDGNTLVVGSVGESSAAKGINKLPTGILSLSGAAYVFVKEFDKTKATYGTWSQQAFIKASNPGDGDSFGGSVAISDDGNTIAISAYHEDSSSTVVTSGSSFADQNSATDSGAVYVFIRSGVNWTQHAYIKASNSRPLNAFGGSISLSGDGLTLAVGSNAEASITRSIVIGANPPVYPVASKYAASLSGSAYVFKRNGTTWEQQAFIKAFNARNSNYFGSSVALNQDGTSLAVGATFESSNDIGVSTAFPTPVDPLVNPKGASGAVYTFKLNSGVWAREAFIKATNTGVNSLFGNDVSFSSDGNTLVVGAYYENSSTTNPADNTSAITHQGAVFVLTRSSTQKLWSHTAYLKANHIDDGDEFGKSISISGDGNTIAVGADFEDSNTIGITNTFNKGAIKSGAVYIFKRNGNLWNSEKYFIKAKNTETITFFGYTVSLDKDGSKLAVGSQYENSGSSGINNPSSGQSLHSGAVYLY